MKPFALTTVAAAALSLAAPTQAAAPAAEHPAVQRALGHLAQQAGLARTAAGVDSFEPQDLIVDADGAEHVRLNRRYRGLPVIGGDLVVHSTARGALSGLSQTQTGPWDLDIRPTLPGSAAAAFALGRFAGLPDHRDGRVLSQTLVVHGRGGQPRLAWDIRISGRQARGTPSDAHLIVSAHGRRLLDHWDAVQTIDHVSTGKTLYAGEVPINDVTNRDRSRFRLIDMTRGGHFVTDQHSQRSRDVETLFKGRNPVWGNGLETHNESAAADAAYGHAVTWDFYRDVLGRRGINDDGQGAHSRVHFDAGYDNAYWWDDCYCMTYGDGWFFKPLVSVDVAGHEMTHGVTSRTAGLIYAGESGGLNEGTSDIMGTMIEFHAGNPNIPPNYDIGEQIYRAPGEALRYMHHPSLDGLSADCWYDGVGFLDVHYSSGVTNHFFYLLAEGTHPAGLPVSPTCQPGDKRRATGTAVLRGIGRDKAVRIWYRALTVYMNNDELFSKARADTLRAADDLYGAGSAESQAVAAAWSAVNRP